MIVLEKDMSMKFSASSKRFCFSSFPLYFGMLVFWFVLSFSLFLSGRTAICRLG